MHINKVLVTYKSNLRCFLFWFWLSEAKSYTYMHVASTQQGPCHYLQMPGILLSVLPDLLASVCSQRLKRGDGHMRSENKGGDRRPPEAVAPQGPRFLPGEGSGFLVNTLFRRSLCQSLDQFRHQFSGLCLFLLGRLRVISDLLS